MRMAGKTERTFPWNTESVAALDPGPVCSCPTTMIIDGEVYECKGHSDPGCHKHGLEAQLKARQPYYAADNEDSGRPVTAADFKGR